MLYVGPDIHSKQISICVLDETGQVVHRAQVRAMHQMRRMLESLPDRFEVCYEASCGYGHYHDLLRPLASRVLVAHPGQLQLIFRSKNKMDRKDAERLAKLLYLGEVPTAHVPSLDVRTWRELINCRSPMIAKRTRAKNTVRALLRSAGQSAPKESRAVDEGRFGLAPSTDPLHAFAAIAAGSPRGRGRDAHPAITTDRARVESSRPASARCPSAAEHSWGWYPRGRSDRRIHRRSASLPKCQSRRTVLRARTAARSIGRQEPARANYAEGAPVVRRLVAEAAWQARPRSPTARAYFDRAQRDDPSVRAEVFLIPEVPVGQLAIMPRPWAAEWLEDEVASWQSSGLDVVVSLLEDNEVTDLGLGDEPAVCERIGVRLLRFRIPDRGVPASYLTATELVTRFVTELRSDRGVGIHCRIEVGRSALMAVCLLAALGIPVGPASVSVARARGLSVPSIAGLLDWQGDEHRNVGPIEEEQPAGL